MVRKESYPYPTDIPEGRWAVYEVTLPNMPKETVTIAFRSLSDRITLSHQIMIFEPSQWNTPQDLVVYAVEDTANIASPYPAAFNMTLSSQDTNYDGSSVPDFNVTVEDNDEGKSYRQIQQRFGLISCNHCIFESLDEAVLAGSLTWKQTSFEHGRTAALFTISLALSTQYYSSVTTGDQLVMPGVLKFGDEIEADTIMLEVDPFSIHYSYTSEVSVDPF